MVERKDFLGFFYTLPMSERDKRKAHDSGVRNVMVTFQHGRADLAWLTEEGIDITMRLDESDYTDPVHAQLVYGYLRNLPPAMREKISLIVVGVEPEGHLDMTWGSKTGWGNAIRTGADNLTDLERHQKKFHSMRLALQSAGYHVSSPGWRCRDQDMRFGAPPEDGPQPGAIRWAMALLGEYGEADYNGEHLYLWDGTDFDIEQRGERLVAARVALRQQQLVYDEINIGKRSYSKEECMSHSLALCDMLRVAPRVVKGFLFCQNGTPINDEGVEEWPPNMLMDTDLCYALAEAWLEGIGD